MMEIISDNERRENLISQFNEFLEYVSWEFGSEIDCHQLVSSIEYVELFEHMYSQVCDYCSAETNDKIADLVSTIEDSDSITFDEVESAIIEICNMIENISYRHSMNIDNDIYVEKQFALPGGSIKYGRRNSTDAVTPNVDEDDEEEKDSRDADALIEYVKSVTENNEISWFETDMIDKISTNFALNKGLFGGLFDFNHDGKMDSFEKTAEFATFMHIVNESEKEETDTSGTSINSTYHSEDYNDDVEDVLNDAGLDLFDLELMDDDERAEVLEDAGLDPDDFDF